MAGQLAGHGLPDDRIAGGSEKCGWIVDGLGFGAAIDYKAEDVGARLGELAPGSMNVFVDDVGGDILDAVLTHLARGAHIIISGSLSQYDADRPRGPSKLAAAPVDAASMTGSSRPTMQIAIRRPAQSSRGCCRTAS